MSWKVVVLIPLPTNYFCLMKFPLKSSQLMCVHVADDLIKVYPPASLAAHWGIFSSDVLKLVKKLFFIDLDQKDIFPDNHPVSQKKLLSLKCRAKIPPMKVLNFLSYGCSLILLGL